MDAQLLIGKVHIIEWLRPGDRRTGWELFGEVEPMGIASNPRVEVAFYSVATRQGFTAVLSGIETEFMTTGCVPLLHIESHGSDTGIGISEEGFTFLQLMELLVPLNGLTGLRLALVLAAGEGMYAIKMLQPVTRSAVLLVIGPNRGIGQDELARGLQLFYREVFAGRSGDHAIEAMNNAIDPDQMTFFAFNAEQLFHAIYREFMAQRCVEPAISHRLEVIMAEWQETVVSQIGRWPSPEEFARMGEQIRSRLEDHEKMFATFRRNYFWIDRFPENDQRFPITLQDCLR